jgi:hypothetical protein
VIKILALRFGKMKPTGMQGSNAMEAVNEKTFVML